MDPLISGFSAISAAVGLAVGLWGYRLVKVAISLTGFCVGGYLLGLAASTLVPDHRGFLLVAAAAGGLTGAVLFTTIYRAGIFLLGMLAGGALGSVFSGSMPDETGTILVIAAAAVIGGLIALLLQKAVLVVVTALVGSWLVAGVTAHALGVPIDPASWLLNARLMDLRVTAPFLTVFGWLLLSLVFTTYQWRSNRRRSGKG